jgi:hypothetical protein
MALGVLRVPNKAVGVGRERAGVKAPSGCKPKSIVNDREFKKHLVALRLERERKEAQAANAAVKKPPAREHIILLLVDRLPDPFGNDRRIFVQREQHCPLEALWAGDDTRTPPRNGSAAIHPSYCSLTCLPPASTAAAIRSRRVAGIPLQSKTIRGMY